MNHEEIQDLLEDYVDDMLDRETRKLVDDHLKTCAECRQILDDVAPVDVSALGALTYDEATMRRIVRRSLFRTAWNTLLLLFAGWIALWFFAALVIQPLVVNRGGRAADIVQATVDLGIMLNPGAVLADGAISSGLINRQIDLEFAVPVGAGLHPAVTTSTMVGPIGIRDEPRFDSYFDFGGFQGDALDQLSNLGESTVATVSLWFDSPVTIDEAQAIADDPNLDFRVIWAGFDASLDRVEPLEPPIWTAGGTLGYATCLLGDDLGEDLLGATSASFGHGLEFLFGRSSIDTARNSVIAALTNIAGRDELVDYVVEPFDDDKNDFGKIVAELQTDPEVTVLVVTGPSPAIAGYLESESGVSANVLAVDFYNWTAEVCGR
jgi:hypothetical protein